jgi:hypothetical protein
MAHAEPRQPGSKAKGELPANSRVVVVPIVCHGGIILNLGGPRCALIEPGGIMAG